MRLVATGLLLAMAALFLAARHFQGLHPAIPFVRAAAWSLFAASLVDAVNVIRILRYAFVPPSARP